MASCPKLVNSHDNSVIHITNSSFSIGRSLSCDHIIQSLGVSRFHCIIKKSNDKWTLYDRSTNGTLVNSTLYKFNESVDLNPGDVVKLGPNNLDFVFTTFESQPIEDLTVEESAALVEEFKKPLEPPLKESQNEHDGEGSGFLGKGFEKPEQSVKQESNNDMEDELTCSICSELFIKAVTLNCSHTFCKYCIGEWQKNKSTCPICRKAIRNTAPTLALDNFIEKYLSTQSDEVKETRKSVVKDREEGSKTTASMSSVVIEVNSDLEEDDDDEDNFSDFDEEVDYYDGYYGGYGRCYVCQERGHWANSCPHRRRN